MWTTQKLRQSFLDYFASKSHKIVETSSVVPENDNSLLFTNSGMVQFKKNLLGERNDLDRACSVQRCIRAGGKHNDLDDVGKDTYHHTYFEMLGNWSFGDYFKEEAIRFAWEFLVDVVGLNRERLYVTYYDELDKESFRIWSEYLPSNRIISASYKDNFWEMGETGPCGPCTEIHYDRIGGRDASMLVNKDDPDVIEIWNIVFIEYNRSAEKLEPLGRKCIDTGVGLERLLSILMGVRSNYLIDSFTTIIGAIEKSCQFRYRDQMEMTDVAFRVVADHCRTIAVCIHDRVEFSNEGVGYVVRRILRRAVRYAHEILNLEVGQIGRLVEIAAKAIGIRLESVECVNKEEVLFMRTLRRGIDRFNRLVEETKRISGEDLFILYDTYGFPVDLTELMAKERNVEIDYENFEECKKRAIEVSKQSKVKSLCIDPDVCSRFPHTDDSFKYESNDIEAGLLFMAWNGRIITEAYDIPEDVEIGLIFDRTCFYAECGGQVGDSGEIVFKDGFDEIGKFKVVDTEAIKGFVVHKGILNGKINTRGQLSYNDEMRRRTMRNHTGTHILNHFLRTMISTEQRGSLVDPDKLRFDFEGNKLSREMIEDLERKVNEFIESNADVKAVVVDREEAMKKPNIVHMKNEEYPDKVRVVTIEGNNMILEEMCGGTHVKNVSDIGKFRIISESGVSANTRRIVAVTGSKAEELEAEAISYLKRLDLGEIFSVDKTIPFLYKHKIETLSQENKKKIEELSKAQYYKSRAEILASISEIKAGNTEDKIIYCYRPTKNSTKREVNRSIGMLCAEVAKNNIQCLVYSHIGDECLISAATSSNEELISRISSRFPRSHLRISKNMVQGSIIHPDDIYNMFEGFI